MVGSDRFHQVFLDNYRQFLTGKAPSYDATFDNEVHEFGLPQYLLQGGEEMSRLMLQSFRD